MTDTTRATSRPDRGDYPDPSTDDLARAIRAAYEGRNGDHPWSHYKRGRYTAHRTYTEHEPDARPGDKHVTIRVESCERNVICNVPEDSAPQFLSLLEVQP